MDLYFSERFGVDSGVLESYGAFDISIVSDLPLFIDPFLLFNSDKEEYQKLHESIIDYLVFLKDKAAAGLDRGLIASWYQFKEVKQNWLGFTAFGNRGSALGKNFADSLHEQLGRILFNFGEEHVTKGTHLEKLCLIEPGVGRDRISDFTTNLIKGYLLQYTQTFTKEYIDPSDCNDFAVAKARFNYDTETWETRSYYLPSLDNDYVLLTPADMLTRDETWINREDMFKEYHRLPNAVPDEELRAQVNNHFRRQLDKRGSTAKERRDAAGKTFREFPALIDYYIKSKEDNGDRAKAISEKKVADVQRVLVEQLKLAVADIEAKSNFFDKPWTSYDEALDRAREFKHYVENCDGYKVINRAGQPFSRETDVQLFFGLIWYNSRFDVNREPNNGRGPVDFKVSYGSGDKSLIEFKLASNINLKRNIKNQVPIYEAANRTRKSVKVIISYTKEDQLRVDSVLGELRLLNEESIVVIDARNDNKPSASKA